MKKGIFASPRVLLLIGFIFIFSYSKVSALEKCYRINNNNICINNEQYVNLEKIGFSDLEINNLDNEEFNKNKNLKGKVVSKKISYYKDIYYYNEDGTIATNEQIVTADEYNKFNPISIISPYGLTNGYIETNMKKMTTTIICLGNTYRYKISLEWKSNPKVRSNDIIGIGIENDKVYYIGNRTFNQTYCISNSNCKSNSSANFKNQETGIGANFTLPNGNYTILNSYLYFDVGKKISNVTSMKAYGDYKHAIKTTNSVEANSYNINGGGINLFSSVMSKYDSINTSVAQWTGNW